MSVKVSATDLHAISVQWHGSISSLGADSVSMVHYLQSGGCTRVSCAVVVLRATSYKGDPRRSTAGSVALRVLGSGANGAS